MEGGPERNIEKTKYMFCPVIRIQVKIMVQR
jgi:hypothetical protein